VVAYFQIFYRKTRALLLVVTLCGMGLMLVPDGSSAAHVKLFLATRVRRPVSVIRHLGAARGEVRSPSVVSAGINVEPSMRPWRYIGPNPDGWWCQRPYCVQNPDPLMTIRTELALAEKLGVSIVRLEFPWYLIQPGPRSFNWGRADAIVSIARKHHVQLQPVLVYSPQWATSLPTEAPAAVEFRHFVSAVVKRYRHSIHFWEMWNEPDHPHYWTSGVASYVRSILIPGYAGVKSADPHAKVILGGPSSANLAWLNDIYAAGGGSSFDIMAFHDYNGAGQILSHARQVAALLQAHGQDAVPLWLGEYGVQDDTTTDSKQQDLMTTVLTSQTPLSMAIWYNLRDDFSMTCCPPAPSVAGKWGLVQHDGHTQKRGFATLRELLHGPSSTHSRK
jgi:polysaccharide biosynthesis protein PslG